MLCILAKAPKQLLVQEQTKLRVEHCTRTGEYVDTDPTNISAGAVIVLTERIMLNALSTYQHRVQAKPKVKGWAPVDVKKALLQGVESYFPLHDEAFCHDFLVRAEKQQSVVGFFKPFYQRSSKSSTSGGESTTAGGDGDAGGAAGAAAAAGVGKLGDKSDSDENQKLLLYAELCYHFGEEVGCYFAFYR